MKSINGILSVFFASAALVSCRVADNGIDNRSFKLVELNGTEYVSVDSLGVASISFSEDVMHADLGGNQINAAYSTTKDGGIILENSISTLMLVEDSLREDEFTQALGQVSTYQVEDGVLTLFDAEGQAVIKASLSL